MATYTPEQLKQRNESTWTTVQTILAPIQFIVFVTSFGLVVRFLMTGNGYEAANISVLMKIALLWAITITGMFWEKEIFGHWFMAPQFFWEDVFNAVALIMHNIYFIAIWTGQSHENIMVIMLVAYVSYLVNMAQFIIKGIRARGEHAPAKATAQEAA
jgi:3-vinyl bacteriochlorophyllide hydratase